MFSDVFTAVTARELSVYRPEKTAYLSCHLSACGAGLTNLPLTLPENSLILVDDSMPPNGHDKDFIAGQLQDLVQKFSPQAVLLDFQNPPTGESRALCAAIAKALPCPVGITLPYAKELGCPVFLAPPPVNTALNTYLSPWLQRGVFLEIAPQAQKFTVTDTGCVSVPIPFHAVGSLPFTQETLHCHYDVTVMPKKAVFTLKRTGEDLDCLAKQAYRLGVLGVVGLYQELYRL